MLLPIETDPLPKTYLHTAYPMGIIMVANYPTAIHWLCQNYIQLNINKKTLDMNFFQLEHFIKWPMFDRKWFYKKEFSQEKEKLLTLIKSFLKEGYYAYLFVDEYYIPQRTAYQKFKFSHDILIYGYGDDFFNVIGYCDDGYYKASTVSFGAFYSSFWINVDLNPNAVINFLKYDTAYKSYINTNALFQSLWSYQHSVGIYEYESSNLGQNSIRYLISHIDDLLKEKQTIDHRIFHAIHQHKKCMSVRFKLFQNIKRLNLDCLETITVFREVEEKAFMCLSLALKFNLSPSNSIINKIKNALSEMLDIESKALRLAEPTCKKLLEIPVLIPHDDTDYSIVNSLR